MLFSLDSRFPTPSSRRTIKLEAVTYRFADGLLIGSSRGWIISYYISSHIRRDGRRLFWGLTNNNKRLFTPSRVTFLFPSPSFLREYHLSGFTISETGRRTTNDQDHRNPSFRNTHFHSPSNERIGRLPPSIHQSSSTFRSTWTLTINLSSQRID